MIVLTNRDRSKAKVNKGGDSMYTIDPLSGYVVAVIDGVSILFEDLDAYYDYIDSDP